MSNRAPEEPTELVYLPRPSWAPAFVTGGAAFAVLGLFSGWVYLAFGLAVAVIAIGAWGGSAARDFLRRPRRQRARSAVLPPRTLQRPK